MTETERKIILTFAEHDMCSTATADALFYHRNTIDYHLRRIKQVYGIDPKTFYGLNALIAIATREDGE